MLSVLIRGVLMRKKLSLCLIDCNIQHSSVHKYLSLKELCFIALLINVQYVFYEDNSQIKVVTD
jgi:hypothetical protein